jgi:hypothetical protein
MLSMTRIDIAALQKAYARKSETSAAGRITGPASGHGLGRERRMRERERRHPPLPRMRAPSQRAPTGADLRVVEYEIGYPVAGLPAGQEVDYGVCLPAIGMWAWSQGRRCPLARD